MVRLELCLLREIGRVKADAFLVLAALKRDVGLTVEEDGWLRAADVADHLTWTRDRTIMALCIAVFMLFPGN